MASGLVTSFDKAIAEDSHRQTFLEDVVNEGGLPLGVNKVTYCPVSEVLEEGKLTIMLTAPSLLAQLSIPRTKAEVIVYPAAFLKLAFHHNLDDFLSTLEDHEYFHAKEMYECPQKVVVPFWKKSELIQKCLFDIGFEMYLKIKKQCPHPVIDSLFWKLGESATKSLWGGWGTCLQDLIKFNLERELRAVKNQIQNFPKRDCSLEYQNKLLYTGRVYEQQIKQLSCR